MSAWVLLALWIVCGVIAAGLQYATVQREFPGIAAENRRADTWLVIAFGCTGPVALLAVVISNAVQGYHHGWLCPGTVDPTLPTSWDEYYERRLSDRRGTEHGSCPDGSTR